MEDGQRTNHMIGGLEFSVPQSDLTVWGKGLEIELITGGQCFDQSCMCNETSIKTVSNQALESF